MRSSDADRRHLTVKDLAEREAVTVKTVYKWNEQGTGPRYLRIGKHCRYRFTDVITWEKSRLAERGRVA